MTWEPVSGDTMLEKFSTVMGTVAPACQMTTLQDAKKFAQKKTELFYYNDGTHEVVLGFKWSNGVEMWCLTQLAFNGPLGTKVYKIVHDGIVSFMDSHKLDRIYAIRPVYGSGNIMDKFYEKIADSTYWKIEVEQETKDMAVWILPRKGAVEING